MSDSAPSGLAPLLDWGWRKNRAVLLSAAAAAAVAAYVLYDDDESSEVSEPPSAGSASGAQRGLTLVARTFPFRNVPRVPTARVPPRRRSAALFRPIFARRQGAGPLPGP